MKTNTRGMGEMIVGKNKKSGFDEQNKQSSAIDLPDGGKKETTIPICRSGSTRCKKW